MAVVNAADFVVKCIVLLNQGIFGIFRMAWLNKEATTILSDLMMRERGIDARTKPMRRIFAQVVFERGINRLDGHL